MRVLVELFRYQKIYLRIVSFVFRLNFRFVRSIIVVKVHSDLEMSDLSSHALVNEENSGCESDFETQDKSGKSKVRKKRKDLQNQREPVAMASTNTDDETESQLNFEETVANSTPYTSPMSLHYQDKMRRRLQFFFMNPVEKWQAKRR